MKLRWVGLLVFGLMPVAASAYQFRVGETTNALALPAGERIAEEALWAANSLDVHGRADRDLWLLATAAVRCDGEVGGDLRVFSSSAVIGGAAQGNLFAYANALQLTTTSVVRGEAALFGATLICEGAVDGNAWLMARSVTLGGRWGGDVRVRADEIRIVPGTRIAGDLIYSSAKPLVHDASVEIGGATTLAPALAAQAGPQSPLALHGYLFLAALLVGMPFVGLFPLLAGGAVRRLRATPWRALGAGLVALLAGPVLAMFAFATIVGIPLALMLGALYLALIYLAHVVVALWIGHALLRAQGPQTFARVLSALAVGLFALYAGAAIPGFVGFVAFPVVAFGLGALVLAILQRPFLPVGLPPPPLPKKPETPENPNQGTAP